MNKFLLHNPKLNQLAKNLRNGSTFPEVLLWQKIKGKQLGVKFQRQKVLGNYIADFYCESLKLVIEIDGATHSSDSEIKYDKTRQEYIESLELKVLRFNNTDIYKDMDSVIETIVQFIDEIRK